MDMVIQGRFWRYTKSLASCFASNLYTVHLFDMIGFGYSGGKRFSSTENKINENFLSVLNNINKSQPLFGVLISLCTWIRSDFLR